MLLPLLASLSLAAPSDSGAAPAAPLAPSKPACEGSLRPGAWGLGFRAFGEAPEIRIRRATSSAWALGLDVSWSGFFEEEDGSSLLSSRIDYGEPSYSSRESSGEVQRTEVRIELPLERVIASAGTLRATTSFGPLFSIAHSERQDAVPPTDDQYGWRENRSERVFHLGLVAGAGIQWEFLPGLSLATSFGADAWKSWGESSNRYTTYSAASRNKDDATVSSDLSGFGTSSWFGGFGLDAWF